jgi:hypothetical protein
MNKLILSVIISIAIAPVAMGMTKENSTSLAKESNNSYSIAGFLEDLKDTVDTVDKVVNTTSDGTQETTSTQPPDNPFENANTNNNSQQPTNNFGQQTNTTPVEGSTQAQPNDPAKTPSNNDSNYFPW